MRLSNLACRRFGNRLLHYPKVLHCDVRRRHAASTFYHRVCKCANGEQIKNRWGICCELIGRFMQHFAENGCRLLFQPGEICRRRKLKVSNLNPHVWKKWGLTSIYILTPKVVSVEEHELDPVALVQRHQADQQQEDGAQTSGQLHRVHQLC